MSSDTTGEIWVVSRQDGGNASDASPTSGLPPTGTGAPPAGSSSPGAAAVNGVSVGGLAMVLAGVMAVM